MPQMLKRFKENKKGRDFAVGDLHGCIDQLHAALLSVNFNKKVDRLFSVGDLVDRGPNSLACLRLLNERWFHAVRGNHEDMMVHAISKTESFDMRGAWFRNGGDWYNTLTPQELIELDELLVKVKKLPYVIEVPCNNKMIGILHAEHFGESWVTKKDLELPYVLDAILWGRGYGLMRPHEATEAHIMKGIDVVIGGHTPREWAPFYIQNRLFIDGGCYMSVIEKRNWGKLIIVNLAEV